MKSHHGATRVGRVVRWQRWTTYALLSACAATGLVWFALMDGLNWQPPEMLFWWIAHGVTGFFAVMVIGMALPHHLVAAWRHHRNRILGSVALATLGLLGVSALLLLYGREAWHPTVHWLHVGVGIGALVAFPLHVVRGRHSIGKSVRPVRPEVPVSPSSVARP